MRRASRTLTDKAYTYLEELIVTLKLPPGSAVSEAMLSRRLRIGRTPIREALQWLACQGLVEIRTRQCPYVANIRVTDLQELFELRQESEGYAAALAAARATANDLARLQHTLCGLDQLNPQGDIAGHIELDRDFHRGVSQASHNRFLQALLTRLYNLNLRLWYLALDRVGPMRASIEQHRAVFEAMGRRDAPGAESAMRQHIREFQDRIRAVI